FPPALVHPKRVQPIVEVIARRDRREHLLHARPLVRDRVRVLQQLIVPGRRRAFRHRDDYSAFASARLASAIRMTPRLVNDSTLESRFQTASTTGFARPNRSGRTAIPLM